MLENNRDHHGASSVEGLLPEISVVIPVYCEATILQEVMAYLLKVMDSTGQPYEVIIIDDGSTDESWEVIRRLSASSAMLRAARLSRNFGKEAALFAGLGMSRGRAAIVMDADLQHPPDLIPKMIEHWQSGQYDIVESVKIGRGREPLGYKMSAALFYRLMDSLTGLGISNASDFKLLDRLVLDELLRMREIGLFFRGMTKWLGFRRKRLDFEVNERVGGSSGWSLGRLLRLFVGSITSFSIIPLHFVTFCGLIFLVFSVALGARALYLKATGAAVTGFTTVILLQLIIGSLLMISLGIIGEYIASIHNEVKGRPRFVVMETIEGGGEGNGRPEGSP